MSEETTASTSSSNNSNSNSNSKDEKKKAMAEDEDQAALTTSGRKSRATGLRAMPAGYQPTENDVICAKGNDAKKHPGQCFVVESWLSYS